LAYIPISEQCNFIWLIIVLDHQEDIKGCHSSTFWNLSRSY